MRNQLRVEKIGIDDTGYPEKLREIPNPPQTLFLKGSASCLKQDGVAIVGTRKATSLGLKVAENIAYELGSLGFVIISGLALGIDSAAHKGALKAGAKTIAVLGAGVERVYPAQHQNLAEQILSSGGAIISDFSREDLGHKGIFLQRNRIISGLAIATVVVEAPQKSGSINTAGWAADQGKPVFVIPGPINHPNYKGSHALIRDGATLVTSAKDILEDLGIKAGETSATGSRGKGQSELRFDNETEKIIIQALMQAGKPQNIDEIINLTGLDAQNVSVSLSVLTIKEIILETPGGYTIA